MPMLRLQFKPTVDVEQTASLNRGGWSVSSLIRFRQGLVEALLGWTAICTTVLQGVARAIHYWSDLSSVARFAIGTTSKLYLFPAASPPSGALIDITPSAGFVPGKVSSGTTPYSLLIWSLDNFGEFLIANPSQQGIFVWMPSQGATPATLITTTATLTGAEIAPTLAPWLGIANGGFSIAISGVIHNVTGLNFTAVTNVADIANIIQAGVAGLATVQGSLLPDGNWQFTISLTSPSATLSYANVPSGATDISVMLAWTSGTAISLSPGGQPPLQSQGIVVLDQAQIILSWGCTPVGGGASDPMLLRWCTQSDYTDWVASTTNSAGSYRLPHGSRIIGAHRMPGMAVLWTDIGLWAVQFIGIPLIFSFNNIGQQCGMIAQKAGDSLGQLLYWMSDHGFFVMSGGGPQQLPCPVWDIVYKNLDLANADKCLIGTNYHYSEVWWFYPSKSGKTGEIDSYVEINIETSSWDYGPATANAANPALPGTPNMYARTAWTDSNQPGSPVSVDLGNLLQETDQGFTANGAPIVGQTIQSGFSDIADGKLMMTVDQFMPDFKWDGPNPSLQLTILLRGYPGEPTTVSGPYTITPTTEYVTLRKPLTSMIDGQNVTAWPAPRGREIAVQITTVSGWWRWGNNRIRAAPSGTLP